MRTPAVSGTPAVRSNTVTNGLVRRPLVNRWYALQRDCWTFLADYFQPAALAFALVCVVLLGGVAVALCFPGVAR